MLVHSGGQKGSGLLGLDFRRMADAVASRLFARNDSKAVFTLMFGSYFGDWDNPDNLLRAPLAGTANSLGLTNAWSGRGGRGAGARGGGRPPPRPWATALGG